MDPKQSTPLTPDQKQLDFYEHEAKQPMKIATSHTHSHTHSHPSSLAPSLPHSHTHTPGSKSSGFLPSSPTDRLLSPCSRKLLRKKSSLHDHDPDSLTPSLTHSPESPSYDFWAPPEQVRVVLGSSSQCRSDILAEMGWSFTVMSPDIDERAVEVSVLTHALTHSLIHSFMSMMN
jgi:hypothetical protein